MEMANESSPFCIYKKRYFNKKDKKIGFLKNSAKKGGMELL